MSRSKRYEVEKLIRVSRAELSAWESASARMQRTVSAWIRDCCNAAVKGIAAHDAAVAGAIAAARMGRAAKPARKRGGKGKVRK